MVMLYEKNIIHILIIPFIYWTELTAINYLLNGPN